MGAGIACPAEALDSGLKVERFGFAPPWERTGGLFRVDEWFLQLCLLLEHVRRLFSVWDPTVTHASRGSTRTCQSFDTFAQRLQKAQKVSIGDLQVLSVSTPRKKMECSNATFRAVKWFAVQMKCYSAGKELQVPTLLASFPFENQNTRRWCSEMKFRRATWRIQFI